MHGAVAELDARAIVADKVGDFQYIFQVRVAALTFATFCGLVVDDGISEEIGAHLVTIDRYAIEMPGGLGDRLVVVRLGHRVEEGAHDLGEIRLVGAGDHGQHLAVEVEIDVVFVDQRLEPAHPPLVVEELAPLRDVRPQVLAG